MKRDNSKRSKSWRRGMSKLRIPGTQPSTRPLTKKSSYGHNLVTGEQYFLTRHETSHQSTYTKSVPHHKGCSLRRAFPQHLRRNRPSFVTFLHRAAVKELENKGTFPVTNRLFSLRRKVNPCFKQTVHHSDLHYFKNEKKTQNRRSPIYAHYRKRLCGVRRSPIHLQHG